MYTVKKGNAYAYDKYRYLGNSITSIYTVLH